MSYLIHFNPNHDPKNGQFTTSRHISSTGGLTKDAKRWYGLDKLDPNKKDFNPKKANKALIKENAKVFNSWRYDVPSVKELLNGKYTETNEEANDRMEEDIKNANKDKAFVSDWKNAVKDVFNSMNSEDDDWIDKEDEVTGKLHKKYPQYKDLIDGFSPHEKFGYNYETNKYKGLDNYLKSNKDPIGEMLNYDYYYEPQTYEVSKQTADKLIKAINKELVDYYIKKYGQEAVPKDWF